MQASVAVVHRLSCPGVWDLPGPEIKPVPSIGRWFLSTLLPGKPQVYSFIKSQIHIYHIYALTTPHLAYTPYHLLPPLYTHPPPTSSLLQSQAGASRVCDGPGHRHQQ